MSSKTILVIGSTNTDMVVKSKRLPLPGETILGGTFYLNAGGKGANQAVAVSRLGGNVVFVSKIGNDIFGKQTLDNLRKENINTDFVFVDAKEPSGTALIMVNQEGENCIVVAPGANVNLLPADINKAKMIATAEIILMQLEIPMETIAAVLKTAKSNSQKVIINPAPAQPLEDEILKDLFLITPNETEASLLTDVLVVDEATASEAAAVFLSKGVQNVIITMGKQGAFFQNNKLKLSIPAPNVKPIDTTAAGDTFNGAIAVAINEGMDWPSAVKFAVMAASVSVTRMGAQASVPYRNELVL
jgi:ribokinase